MAPAAALTPLKPSVQFIHFNDVYNIDVGHREPVGGAARFVTALRKAQSSYSGPSFVIFSGDAFSPAPLTPHTQGAEMPPVLNALQVDVACAGNHEFDNGIDVMKQRVSECRFPWLLSNVKYGCQGRVVGDIEEWVIIEREGVKVGFIGLASEAWVVALDKIDKNDLIVEDYVQCADRLARKLRADGCDMVVAVTHMRQPDDYRLAHEGMDLDIILGGHDHIVCARFVNGRYIVKSGTDFKNFATIEMKVVDNWAFEALPPVHHDVTSDVPEDTGMARFVEQQLRQLGDAYKRILALSEAELDGRFVSIRTRETGLGNFICDVVAAYMDAKIGLVNSGSFRSDTIESPGKISQQTVDSILSFRDEVILAEYTGAQLISTLEVSVSQYPLLDGRFLQVSGLSFEFDPRKPPASRVLRDSVQVKEADNLMHPLDESKTYRVALKTYIFDGKDGYEQGNPSRIINRSDATIPYMVAHCLGNDNGSRLRDSDGIPCIAPEVEGRIVCLAPNEELLNAYDSLR